MHLDPNDSAPSVTSVHKFRLSARIAFALGIAFYLFAFGATIWIFFLSGSKWSDYVFGVLGVGIFGFTYKTYAKQAAHCLFYQLRVDDTGITMTDQSVQITIPFRDITTFTDLVLTDDESGKCGGYRFCVEGDQGVVSFSTQIVGWAEIIASLHTAAPRVVPPPSRLDAHQLLEGTTLSVEARAMTAPPYRSQRAWNSAGIACWYDSVIGFVVAGALALVVVKFPGRWLIVLFKDNGWPSTVAFVIILIPTLMVFRPVASRVTDGVRTLRNKLLRR